MTDRIDTTAAVFDAPEPEIILDISRLMSRILHATPTGVDRVEMAYARALMDRIPHRLGFAALRPRGTYNRLEAQGVKTFLDQLERQWRGEIAPPTNKFAAAMRLLRVKSIPTPSAVPDHGRIYLQSSPHHLDRPDVVRKILAREQARLVGMVHDLIPIEFPEYARPDGEELHRRRMETLSELASAIIANSQATADAFSRHCAQRGDAPPVTVALLGIDQPYPTTSMTDRENYFVYISTIEPRKNHLLLLHIWRSMIDNSAFGSEIPKLILVGRRGWENENVVDMLERCPALRGHVVELNDLPDQDVQALIRGARATLLPSFAEGYGLPVGEALALGCPVICSDLGALREVGGSVPEYLDPLDGPAWIAAITDYSHPASRRRADQITRLGSWTLPSWQRHFDIVLQLCGDIARGRAPAEPPVS